MYGNGQDARAYGVANGGGAVGMAATPMNVQTARMPMVSQQVEALGKSTEVIHQLISQLEDRLSAVLMPTPPEGNQAREGRPHPGVALAAGLMEINARVESAVIRLNSLMQRVEV
jgi:hypothetical protein